MAHIRPFRAVRPAADKVHLVASRSYVTYSDEQLRDKLKHNPYSFVQIIHPDFNDALPSEPGTPERFERVHEKYLEFLKQDILQVDDQPALYVYRQSHSNLDCIGIIGAVHNNDYRSKHVRIHEQTLAAREALFAQYLDMTGFNAEPILLTHDDDEVLNGWLQALHGRTADVHFTTADEVSHQLWKIDNAEELDFLCGLYGRMGALYIADGHHRSASSVRLADERLASGRAQEDDPVNYFLAFMIPASRLRIHGYHRLVKSLNGLSKDEFINRLKALPFVLVTEQREVATLPGTGTISVYVQGSWHLVDFRAIAREEEPDAEWLTNQILAPLLGIEDLRNDSRIAFEPETTGLEQICARVDSGKFACAFFLHPVPFNQLKAVSDADRSLPPKSTWIEPKLRSGLVVYDFDNSPTF